MLLQRKLRCGAGALTHCSSGSDGSGSEVDASTLLWYNFTKNITCCNIFLLFPKHLIQFYYEKIRLKKNILMLTYTKIGLQLGSGRSRCRIKMMLLHNAELGFIIIGHLSDFAFFFIDLKSFRK
jgi:hypothetical protein